MSESERMIAWRPRHGYSQQELANALGVAKSTIQRWEAGQMPIPRYIWLALTELARTRHIKTARREHQKCSEGTLEVQEPYTDGV
jgi:transcriptional regulator with XRE-family HTH domain